MVMNNNSLDPRKALSGFCIYGDFVDVKPYGTGHINDTFLATYNQGGTVVRYTLQHLNTAIFKDPVGLMDNVRRVTEHSRRRLIETNDPEPSRKALSLIPACKGGVLHFDEEGNAWRCYSFIEGAFTVDIVDSEKSAFEAARSFSRFQALLADMEGERLNETIPDFHNTPKRYRDFHAALDADKMGRAKEVQAEIDFALSQEADAGRIVNLMKSGEMPERATHNDTKINNVLLDEKTGEGICVIDLDTVMPNYIFSDFGDFLRSAANTGREDDKELDNVNFNMEIFEAFTKGYLKSARCFLTPLEIENLPYAAALFPYMQTVRFLADYINGDTYYKIQYPEHNLVRSKAQFKLLQSVEAHKEQMQEFIKQQLA